MEIITVGSSAVSTTILAILWTENPQAMIAIGGVLCAIFGGLTAALFARKKDKDKEEKRRNAVKQV